jgi:hypothetical protein
MSDSNSTIIRLEALGKEYDNTLIEYKQAYNDYANYLKNGTQTPEYLALSLNGSNNTYCRGDGWDQNGWPKGVGYMTDANCAAACTSNTECTAYDIARPDTTAGTFDCYLFGHNNITPMADASTYGCHQKIYSQDESTVYKNKLSSLNAKLISLNNEIIQIMSQSYPDYKNEVMERNQKKTELEQNYLALVAERDRVNAKVNEYESLDEAQNNGEIIITEYYYKYIGYLLLAIIIIIIFFRVISNGNSSGQQLGGGNRRSEYMFLIGIMVIFVGLAVKFREVASTLIFFIVVGTAILMKMKIIHK